MTPITRTVCTYLVLAAITGGALGRVSDNSSYPDSDPYLTRTLNLCVAGEVGECLKSSALTSFQALVSRESFELNEHARIVKMAADPTEEESYDYTDSLLGTKEARSSEWGEFVDFISRKVETFVKSTMIQVDLTPELTQGGRYAPRFLDEITSEINVLEDKNDNIFSRTKMKKLLIPLLLVLKVFKLKLLLFLPLILGLASFKKLLGFLAIAVPALVGFFKLCKPDLHHSYGSFGHSSYYNRPPHQYKVATLNNIYSRAGQSSQAGEHLRERDDFAQTQNSPTYPFIMPDYHRNSERARNSDRNTHSIAYNGYHDYYTNK